LAGASSRRFRDPRFFFALLLAPLFIAISTGFVKGSQDIVVTCRPAPGPSLQCQTRLWEGSAVQPSLHGTAKPGDVKDLAVVHANFEHEGSRSRLLVGFVLGEPQAVTPWLQPDGLPDVQTFQATLRRGEPASLSYHVAASGFLPTLGVGLFFLFGLVAFSGSTRARVDPNSREPQVEIETTRGWLRETRRERIPLREVGGVQLLKSEQREGRVLWQLALMRRGGELSLVGIPVGRPAAERWCRSLATLVDAGSPS